MQTHGKLASNDQPRLSGRFTHMTSSMDPDATITPTDATVVESTVTQTGDRLAVHTTDGTNDCNVSPASSNTTTGRLGIYWLIDLLIDWYLQAVEHSRMCTRHRQRRLAIIYRWIRLIELGKLDLYGPLLSVCKLHDLENIIFRSVFFCFWWRFRVSLKIQYYTFLFCNSDAMCWWLEFQQFKIFNFPKYNYEFDIYKIIEQYLCEKLYG